VKFLIRRSPRDQDTAFAPVGCIGSAPLMITVNNHVPARTLKEFVGLAKARPGQVPVAGRVASGGGRSPGPASIAAAPGW
jgi:tripartite-type tricarboxylate transporter receptor subunit TctC